jgi:hypothetical protein
MMTSGSEVMADKILVRHVAQKVQTLCRREMPTGIS